MANGLFSGFNPLVSKDDKQGAKQYLSETRFGELPPVGQTFGDGPQPITIGEGGGSVVIDPTNPTTQARPEQMEAGLPIVPAMIGAGAATTPLTQLTQFGGSKPPVQTGQLGRFMGRPMKTVSGVARNVAPRALPGAVGATAMGSALPTAAAIYGIEEAPKLFGSEKSTSEILTELAATSPEERAGAAEYSALGANLAGLGGGMSETVSDEEVSRPTPNLSQFMRYDDAAETEQFVDPQGRLRIRMKDTKELAPQYSGYERQAAAREARLEAKPDFMEAQPVESRRTAAATGIPTDAELRDLAQARMPEASEGDIARGMKVAARYGIDPFTGKRPEVVDPELERLKKEQIQTGIESNRARLAEAGLRPTADPEVDPETGIITQLYSDGIKKFLGQARLDEIGSLDLSSFMVDSDQEKEDKKKGKKKDKEGFSIIK